jgi:hypothetical protein
VPPRSVVITNLLSEIKSAIWKWSLSSVLILYNVGSLMDTNCTCYVTDDTIQFVTLVYFRLHCRHYNLSSYNEYWPSVVLPRSDPLMSSPSECWQLTDWLTVINWLLVTDLTIRDWLLAVKIQTRYRTPSLMVVYSVTTILLLRKHNSSACILRSNKFISVSHVFRKLLRKKRRNPYPAVV